MAAAMVDIETGEPLTDAQMDELDAQFHALIDASADEVEHLLLEMARADARDAAMTTDPNEAPF
jgi:hypothetical protein